MPVTRSRGRAEKWMAEAGNGSSSRPSQAINPTESSHPSSHIEVVRSPRTPGEPHASTSSAPFGDSTLPSGGRGNSREVSPLRHTDSKLATINIENKSDGPPEEPIVSKPSGSQKTSRSRRKAREARREILRIKLEARREILRIKLELAQLALEDVESDSSGYEDDSQSKTSYVRSWIENSEDAMPKPQPEMQIFLEEDDPRKPHPKPSSCVKPESLAIAKRQGTESVTTLTKPHPDFVKHYEDLTSNTKLRHPLSEIDEMKKEIELLKQNRASSIGCEPFHPMSSGFTAAPAEYRKALLTTSPSSAVASKILIDPYL
ncbi:unnamed protein product, partial [Brenthis ino]